MKHFFRLKHIHLQWQNFFHIHTHLHKTQLLLWMPLATNQVIYAIYSLYSWGMLSFIIHLAVVPLCIYETKLWLQQEQEQCGLKQTIKQWVKEEVTTAFWKVGESWKQKGKVGRFNLGIKKEKSLLKKDGREGGHNTSRAVLCLGAGMMFLSVRVPTENRWCIQNG